LEGIQLAVEETSVGGIKPQIELTIYADKSSDKEAKNGATKTVAS
jgi:ABC-type branched-subunit amino acid transport system substrate-binding protein